MFRFFRRRDTMVRWFLGGLLVLICVMLVVTLIPGLSTPTSTDDNSVLATVAGEPVTAFELQRQLQQVARNNRVPATMLSMYVPQILNQMLQDKASLYEARRMGLLVTDTEVTEQLRENPTFFPGGEFIGEDRFREVVEQSFGMSESQFWEKFRESLLANKLRRIITDTVTISDAELDREYHRRNDKLKIDYVLLKPANFTAQVQVTDADLKASFDRNRTAYSIPEKRSVKFLYLDLEKVRENVEVSEPEIRQFYEQNKARYRVEDRVQVAHILLKTVGKTPQQSADLEKTAKELVQKARGGEDFAALAKKYSEDTASQVKGGELGWIARGQTVPEFEKAAFSLEPGQISEVIKTVYGFHILKVAARERAHQQTLEEVRAQVLPQVKQEKGERAAQEAADRLEATLRRNGKNLQAAAAELKLPLVDAPAHARGEPLPQFGPSAPFDDAAFALKAGEVSSVVNAGKGLAVLRAVEITPSRPAELAEVRDRVEKEYRAAMAAQLVEKRAQELAGRARSLNDLKKAADLLKLTAKTSEAFTREGAIPEAGPVATFASAAFNAKVGEIAGPVTLNDGQLVYRVAEQLFATPDEAAKNRDSLRSELVDRKREAAYQIFLENLKNRLEKEGKLKTSPAALQRFTRNMQ